LVVAVIIALGLIIIPLLQKEIPLLQEQIPIFFIRLNEFFSPILRELGIDVRLDGIGLKKLVTDHVSTSRESFWISVLASAKIGGTAVMGWIWNLILIPVVLFYLLLDWPLLLRRMKNGVPRRWTAKTLGMAAEVNAMLAQYLRGQLLVMLILSAYYSVALVLADYNVALPIGLITGILAFVPYVGYGIGLILATIATMLQFGDLQGFMILAIIYGLGTVLEGFILTPKLVGKRIQLHPLTVIFALLAFAQLFGFVGVLLALPSSAILSVAYRHLRIYYINSNFYNS
jgi:predicted PurR-regulated permease PerM